MWRLSGSGAACCALPGSEAARQAAKSVRRQVKRHGEAWKGVRVMLFVFEEFHLSGDFVHHVSLALSSVGVKVLPRFFLRGLLFRIVVGFFRFRVSQRFQFDDGFGLEGREALAFGLEALHGDETFRVDLQWRAECVVASGK